MQEKRVTEREIFAALSYGSIVEAHNETADEIRVLVRGKVAGKFICVVVSLTTKTIVTVYRNQSSDFHRTLDRNAYQWTENLIGV
jgi:hypothetical protein